MTRAPGNTTHLRRRSALELAAVVGAALATWALASVLDLHESLSAFLARHESWQADELAIALGVLAAGLALHALRRRREAEQALVAEQRALADAARLAERNADLARGLIALQEAERAAIARELHDEMGQACTALRMETALLRRAAACADADAARAAAMRADRQAETLLHAVRSLLQRLRPLHLDTLGLAASLQELCDGWQARSGVRCRLHDARTAELELDDEIELVVYRVAQEALTNVMRHAQARSVAVQLAHEGPTLVLVVEDDGVGLPPEGQRHGLGLLGARERAAALGGTLALHGAPGAGTRLVLTLPLRAAHALRALEASA